MSVILNSNAASSSALLTATTSSASNTRLAPRLNLDLGATPSAAASTGLFSASSATATDVASQALDRAASIADAATGAGASISDALVQIRQTVASAAEPDTTPAGRAALTAKYQSLVQGVGAAVKSASFDGVNLLDGSSEPAGLSVQTTADASAAVTLHGADLKPGGAIVALPSAADLASPSSARAALDQVDTSIVATQGALARIDTQSKSVAAHADALATLSSAGLSGDATDADSAGLIALQVRQQLSGQSTSLVSAASQSILSLFKS